MTKRSLFRAMAFLSAAVVVSCSDSTTAPSSVAGTYVATQFVLTSGGTTTDVLAMGATITLVLDQAGGTTGRILVPASASDEGIDADLAGTWTSDGETIHFQHTADTFIRDMPFSAVDGKLIGDRLFGDNEIRVELTRR